MFDLETQTLNYVSICGVYMSTCMTQFETMFCDCIYTVMVYSQNYIREIDITKLFHMHQARSPLHRLNIEIFLRDISGCGPSGGMVKVSAAKPVCEHNTFCMKLLYN